MFNLNRGDSSRTAVLKVTFLDNTTASTSGRNGGAVYFHELSANRTNPIVKFTIQNSNLNRYDDVAFIDTNAPAPALAVGNTYGVRGESGRAGNHEYAVRRSCWRNTPLQISMADRRWQRWNPDQHPQRHQRHVFREHDGNDLGG